MALDFFTSFDLPGSLTDMTTGPTPVFDTAPFAALGAGGNQRNGAQCLSMSSAFAYCYTPVLAQGNAATRIVGVALKAVGSPAGHDGGTIFAYSDGIPTTAANVQVSVVATSGGYLAAYRGRALGSNSGGTLLGTSANPVILNSTYQYLEFLVTVHGSAGVVSVWADSVLVLDITGANTQSTANAYGNRIGLGATPVTMHWDDLYCITAAGDAPNSRKGDSVMYSQRASTDAVSAGFHADFTPSTGTDHGALVDDSPANTSDYNSCATPGDEDSYKFAALGIAGEVVALNMNNFLQKSDAGTCTARNLVRIGGTDYYGTTRTTSQSWFHQIDPSTVSPATAAQWTEAEMAEFGIERVS